MISPLRPLTVVLGMTHLEAHAKGAVHRDLRPATEPPYFCLFCTCNLSGPHHQMEHPEERIAVNPALVAAVAPLEHGSNRFVVITWAHEPHQTIALGTVDSVLDQLSWPDL